MNSEREVFVTGYGVRCAFGPGRDAFLKSVFPARVAFRPVDRFDASPYRTDLAALDTIVLSQREAMCDCGREALEMAGLAQAGDAAVLLGTGGDFTAVASYWEGVGGGTPAAGDSGRLADSVPAVLVGNVAAALSAAGPRLAFTNGCVAASNAIIHGGRLIRSGRIEVALCGGAYLVENEFFAKFDAGRAFSRDGALRPFSAGRSGLLLGDGAAVLVLESGDHLRRRGGRPLARLAGWGVASDAFHVCQPHPQGAGMAAAISQAFRSAGITGDQVGYVNAHGTGTPANDSAETAGIKKAFGADTTVPVSSTKGSTGHSLEASGALEAVICVIALEEQRIPATASYSGPDPECDLDYVTDGPRDSPLRHVVSLNAAFGGANTALVLARP
jgi:3-oxoacyl-[acyl-carrier-protein] synthase II